MSKEKTLLKNTAIVSVGKIFTQLVTFFLLPVYTAVLTTEEYGIVDLFNTLVSLFLPIVTLQIEQGVFRYLIDCRDNKEEQKKLISTTILFLLVQLIIYVIVFLFVSPFINNQYKYFLLTNLCIATFSSVFLQISRGLGDNVKYAVGSLISGISIVVLNVIFIVAFKLGAYGMLGATFIGNLLCGIYIVIGKKMYKYIKIKAFDKKKLIEIIRYSIPLVPNIISWWVVRASDRTIITYALDVGANGIYAAANKFSNVFNSLYTVFNLTWTESAAVNINTEDRDKFFSNILDIVLRFFGAMAIEIIAVIPFVFPILINEKFEEAYYQIPILMIASIFSVLVSFLGSIYVAKKLTKEVAKTSVIAAIINIIINVCFIKLIGLYAASISTLIAYFAMFVYRLIDSKKYVILKIKKSLVVSMIIVISIAMIGYYINNLYLNIIVFAGVLIYSIYINKNSAKYMYKIVMQKLKKH